MKVKLKVIKGSGAGREVRIPTPKCLIGRSDECHLRPKSEAISRRHCVVYVKGGRVFVRDLNSRNGTFVNGTTVAQDTELQSGDELRVGPLVFGMVIDHTLGGEKKSKVSSVAEAAARTTSGPRDASSLDDSSITDWLEEADEAERNRRLTDPETRQLKLDETDQVKLQQALEQKATAPKDEAEVGQGKAPVVEDTEETTKKKKKVFGKLPQRPESVAKDSQEAAAQMLKKLFNRR